MGLTRSEADVKKQIYLDKLNAETNRDVLTRTFSKRWWQYIEATLLDAEIKTLMVNFRYTLWYVQDDLRNTLGRPRCRLQRQYPAMQPLYQRRTRRVPTGLHHRSPIPCQSDPHGFHPPQPTFSPSYLLLFSEFCIELDRSSLGNVGGPPP